MTNDATWELALAVNAAFKGLLGSMGESGHICARTIPVEGHIETSEGWDSVQDRIVSMVESTVERGDVLVVADKVVAVALKRIGNSSILSDPDPKTVDGPTRERIAESLSTELGLHVTAKHLLLADELGANHASLGTDDPNLRANDLAGRILQATGLEIDCVVSDTDTGLDVRAPLIGAITIGATPLGATNGINLYEAMRCAVAAEFSRGHGRGIPVVICRPADRRKERKTMGEMRPYSGFLDAGREAAVAHA